MRTLVATPMHEEFECLLDGIQREDEDVNRRRLGVIDAAMIDSLRLTVGVGGHGKAQFAAQTQYLISRCEDVELVICAGAAGALVPDLSFGDIVISTSIIEHDYKERFDPEPPPVHRGHQDTLDRMRFFADRRQFFFGVHFGQIASGDEDIVDRDRADQLHTETEALCVAWEGSGGARAAALSSKPFVEIRVITDSSDDSAAADFRENLVNTIPNLSSFLVQWLRTFTP